MVEAEQKSSGPRGMIKLMIWTTLSLLLAGAIGPYLGIQQYLNLVGLGFLNILHIVALVGSVMFLLIIRGILRSDKADRIGSYPTIDRSYRVERKGPVEEQISFESVVLEAKAEMADIQSGPIADRK